MSNNTSSINATPEKVRILGTNEKTPIDENENENENVDEEEDGNMSITLEDDEDDDEDINEGDDGEDEDDDDIIDDDDIEINSDDGLTPAIERVSASTNRGSSKIGKISNIQSMDAVVPPQFLASSNMEEDESDDDIDTGNVTGDDEYDDDDDEDPETYLQKFESDINQNLLLSHHPTQFSKNDSEIAALCQLTRNESNNIIDPLHKTIPFLTKYERTRVLGQRAKQINSGSKPYVVVPDNILDGYIIAQMELAQKRLPFIIERPIHGGGCEYWRVRDLEVL